MIAATPETCRHTSPVAMLEVVSLDKILDEGGDGVVLPAVPADQAEAVMARAEALEAVMARAEALEAANPADRYRVAQIHADGCRTLAARTELASTPAEMFAHARTAPAAPEAEPAPAPAVNPEAPVHEAQTRAYRIADALRPAGWTVRIVIEDKPVQRYTSGGVMFGARRTVTVHAHRLECEPRLMVVFETTMRAGGRTTTRTAYAHTATSSGVKRVRTRAALASWVNTHARPLGFEARPWRLYDDEACEECGAAPAEGGHRDGCRTAAAAPAPEPTTTTTTEKGTTAMTEPTAPAPAAPAPEWRTLAGMQAPFLLWGAYGATGTYLVPARDRTQVSGDPILIVRAWSEQRGTVRFGEDAEGRRLQLGGTATRFWVAAAPAAPTGTNVISVDGGDVHAPHTGYRDDDTAPWHECWSWWGGWAGVADRPRYIHTAEVVTCPDCVKHVEFREGLKRNGPSAT